MKNIFKKPVRQMTPTEWEVEIKKAMDTRTEAQLTAANPMTISLEDLTTGIAVIVMAKAHCFAPRFGVKQTAENMGVVAHLIAAYLHNDFKPQSKESKRIKKAVKRFMESLSDFANVAGDSVIPNPDAPDAKKYYELIGEVYADMRHGFEGDDKIYQGKSA